MGKEEIEAGNKLIAEFMGYEEGYDEHGVWQKLRYHTSWDSLIPVCEKWDQLPKEAFIEGAVVQYVNLSDELDEIVACYDIASVWYQLLKNIGWYNENSTENLTNKVG